MKKSRVTKTGTERYKWHKMVESERLNIIQEMRNYTFSPVNVSLDSLIPERGGQPRRAVVKSYNSNIT